MFRLSQQEVVRGLLSTSCIAFLFALCGRTIRFWDRSGFIMVSGGRELAVLGASLLIAAAVLWCKQRDRITTLISPTPFLWAVLALFLSDWLTRPYNLVQGPEIRGEILICGFACWVLCRYRAWWLATTLLGLTVVAFTWCFYSEARGRLLFSDDHTMFLFRLALLRDNFPSVPFWSPMWNGGFDARDFFATGAFNVFFMTWPILYTLPIEKAYNLIVVGILFFLVPASTWLAASLMELSRRGRIISSILSLASSLLWYRWGLKYGTMGFITSAALVPIVVTLGTQILYGEPSPSRRRMTLFVCTTSLMLLWSPAGAVLLPFALLFAARLRLPNKSQTIILIALLVINIPWMVMLWRVSKVGSFLGSETKASQRETQSLDEKDVGISNDKLPNLTVKSNTSFRHRASGLNFKIALEKIQESSIGTNPLLVLLSIPALALLRSRYRTTFLALTVWLLLLGSVGVSLKPQLELDRMLVLLALLLCVPVGKFIDEFVIPACQVPTTALPATLTLGMVAISPISTLQVIKNRTLEQYYFADESVHGLSAAIRDNAKGGRALFTGCVLHQLSGGHLGPLVYFSGAPLVASSYAHNIWSYRQVIPAAFLARGDEGIVEYFDVMNSTLIVAHEPYWLEYLRERSQRYKEIWRGGKFTVFERVGSVSNYFHQGAGQVLFQTSHSVVVNLSTANAVLKFTYFDFVEAEGCLVSPFETASSDLQLISLRGCPTGTPITIVAKPSWTRLLP